MPRCLLYINQNFVSAHQAGNSRPIHIIAALLDHGFHVDVVTGRTGYLDDAPKHPRDTVLTEREGGLTLHRLPVRSGGPGRRDRGRSYVRFLARALSCLSRIRKTDVVYATSPPLPQVLLSILAGWWRRAPLVLEVRDLWPALAAEMGLLRSRLLIRAMEWTEAFAYRCADHCMPVSPPFAEYLVEMGIPRDKITVVLTGGDPVYDRMDPTEGRRWRKEHGLEGKFVVIYAGSLNEHYGLAPVLRAAEHLCASRADVHWLFAGSGRERARVEQAAARCPAIHYLGGLPKDQLLPAYLAADVGLVTLVPAPLMETVTPGKLFDYLAAGLPVLSLIGGQSGQIIHAARAGVVLEHADADHLARAVLEMADMPARDRRAMGDRGREWVLKHANCVHMADQAAQTVERLSGGRGHVAGLLRMLAAGVGAVGDVAIGRSSKAVHKLFGETRREVICRSFQEWLDRAAEPPDRTPVRRKMPALLSCRDR